MGAEGEGEKQQQERKGERGEEVEGMLSRSAMMINQSSVPLTLPAMIRTLSRLWRETSYKPTLMSNGEGEPSDTRIDIGWLLILTHLSPSMLV